MSYTIVYQSMSVHFPNGLCFVITQDGDNNCTEFNYRTRREVSEKNWRTTRLCADKTHNVLLKESVLLDCIKQNMLEWSSNDLTADSSMAYKARGAFKPYSFWVNHYSNAVKRFSVSAETLLKRFHPLGVYIWGANPDNKENADLRLSVSSVEELYNLFIKYSGKQFNFDLRRDLIVSTLVDSKPMDRSKNLYYVYNIMDNGIYCKHPRQKQLTICCLERKNGRDCKLLDNETEQYLINNFHVKILLFKSIPECVNFFLGRKTERISIDTFIGVVGQQNVPSKETQLKNYLEKSINYEG